MIIQLLKKVLKPHNKSGEVDAIKKEIMTQSTRTVEAINRVNTIFEETTAYKIGRASGGFKK